MTGVRVKAKPLTLWPGSKRRNVRCLGCHSLRMHLWVLHWGPNRYHTGPQRHSGSWSQQKPSYLTISGVVSFLLKALSPLVDLKATCHSPADSRNLTWVCKSRPFRLKEFSRKTQIHSFHCVSPFWWVMTFKNETNTNLAKGILLFMCFPWRSIN